MILHTDGNPASLDSGRSQEIQGGSNSQVAQVQSQSQSQNLSRNSSQYRNTSTPPSRPTQPRRSTTNQSLSQSFTPLPPLMSRENSSENLHSQSGPGVAVPAHLVSAKLHDTTQTMEAGPSSPPRWNVVTRKASKSISTLRPSILPTGNGPTSPNTPRRNHSFYTPLEKLDNSGNSNNPVSGGRKGLKRRISTPNVAAQQQLQHNIPHLDISTSPVNTKVKLAGETRARSTSTSLVVPNQLETTTPPVITVNPPSRPPRPGVSSLPHWQGYKVIPPSPPESSYVPELFSLPQLPKESTPSSRGIKYLTFAYNAGESSIRKLAKYVSGNKSSKAKLQRKLSMDSEKGMEADDEKDEKDSSVASVRSPRESMESNGIIRTKYWGLWSSKDPSTVDLTVPHTGDEDGYFSLPPTPPDNGIHRIAPTPTEFASALNQSNHVPTLPTPALSAHSLRTGLRRSGSDDLKGGWFKPIALKFLGIGPSGKTAEVIKELGWTVLALVALFIVSLGMVLWLIKGLPITQLKRLPSSTKDVQVLSKEIRGYMGESSLGWWHTVGVLIFVGCWKHAWSVPGAVILNILVGSLFHPMPALLLLTIITASGSLFSYLLSRPLAPLIAVLFPKPLALVRAALAPESIPAPSISHGASGLSSSSSSSVPERITPVHLSSNPADPAIGGEPKPVIWRRLLIMRAMGFVPWSGMNVACGVVGVDWKIFWLTTAAGSASWSYVTASVGDILSRIAIPSDTISVSSTEEQSMESGGGESLTGLLRDPVLITKLVFLTLITLIPVFMKKKQQAQQPSNTIPEMLLVEKPTGLPTLDVNVTVPVGAVVPPLTPLSPLTESLARFTPTPAVFDLFSFGRTAVRTGVSGVRGAVVGAGRMVGVAA